MQAEIHLLQKSEFYQIRDFRCACVECNTSRLEQCELFSICFVRKGYYEQHVFRKQQEMHFGRMLLSKPGIEYVIRHIDNQPDLCTSINFTAEFYELLKDHFKDEAGWFLGNPDLQSLLLASSPETEYLHQQILSAVGRGLKLEVDDLIIHLVECVMQTMGRTSPGPLSESLKRNHLRTVEKAKEYLFRNFERDISLQELADHCCVSLFHFGRIFKAILNTTPHQYLTELRLHHAQLQLNTTNLQVTEVAFQSGFNSLEHFVTVYRKYFNTTPSANRERKSRIQNPLQPGL